MERFGGFSLNEQENSNVDALLRDVFPERQSSQNVLSVQGVYAIGRKKKGLRGLINKSLDWFAYATPPAYFTVPSKIPPVLTLDTDTLPRASCWKLEGFLFYNNDTPIATINASGTAPNEISPKTEHPTSVKLEFTDDGILFQAGAKVDDVLVTINTITGKVT